MASWKGRLPQPCRRFLPPSAARVAGRKWVTIVKRLSELAMSPQRLQQIEAVYHPARDREPGERGAFLAEACRGDQELCREVETLLAPDSSEIGILDRPASDGAPGLTGRADSTATVDARGILLGPYQNEG